MIEKFDLFDTNLKPENIVIDQSGQNFHLTGSSNNNRRAFPRVSHAEHDVNTIMMEKPASRRKTVAPKIMIEEQNEEISAKVSPKAQITQQNKFKL